MRTSVLCEIWIVVSVVYTMTRVKVDDKDGPPSSLCVGMMTSWATSVTNRSNWGPRAGHLDRLGEMNRKTSLGVAAYWLVLCECRCRSPPSHPCPCQLATSSLPDSGLAAFLLG